MDLLVTYDIATLTPRGQRRLTQVAKACEGYGVRVQKSVFECRLNAASYTQMLIDLADIIEAREDSINIYRFDGPLGKAKLSIGRPTGIGLGEAWIV